MNTFERIDFLDFSYSFPVFTAWLRFTYLDQYFIGRLLFSVIDSLR